MGWNIEQAGKSCDESRVILQFEQNFLGRDHPYIMLAKGLGGLGLTFSNVYADIGWVGQKKAQKFADIIRMVPARKNCIAFITGFSWLVPVLSCLALQCKVYTVGLCDTQNSHK